MLSSLFSVSLQVWLMIYVILLDIQHREIFETLIIMQIMLMVAESTNLYYIDKKKTKKVKATLCCAFVFACVIIILLGSSKNLIEAANKDETTLIAWCVSIALFALSKIFLIYKNYRYYQLGKTYISVI